MLNALERILERFTDGAHLVRAMGLHDGTTQTQLRVNGAGEIVTLDIVHERIHHGECFEISDYDSEVDIIAPKYWLIKAGLVPCHITFEVESGPSGGLWELTETPTTTADGVNLPVLNSNRNYATSGLALVSRDPTVTADGVVVTRSFQGAAGGATRTGGSTSSRNERVLKVSTNYLLKFTATANDTVCNMRIWYYEQPT